VLPLFYYLQLNIPPPHSGTGSSKSEKDLLLFLRPFSIKQRAEYSFQNALLSGKNEPPEKFLPESPSFSLFCGL